MTKFNNIKHDLYTVNRGSNGSFIFECHIGVETFDNLGINELIDGDNRKPTHSREKHIEMEITELCKSNVPTRDYGPIRKVKMKSLG